MKAPASLSAIAISLALGLAQAGGAEWLDARDLRASGSKFETTAAATDGSKEITVADVGDFQAGQGVMVSKCNIRYRGCRPFVASQAPVRSADEADRAGRPNRSGGPGFQPQAATSFLAAAAIFAASTRM